MAKPNQKGKGPKGPKSPKGRKSLDENGSSQLTSKVDQGLNDSSTRKDQKRKKPPTTESVPQDRKRQRNSGNGPPKSTAKGDDIAALLEEIRALGGDEEDLKLIQDVDSSDDEAVKGGKAPADKRLKDELAALSKELGLAEYQPSEASDDDEAAGEEDEDEIEEDEDDDEDEEEQEEDEQEAPRRIGNMVRHPAHARGVSDH
jgi:ribosome biogenesis protein MAK21